MHAPLSDLIVKSFDGMSSQLQTAARYILDNPRDVALLSMREQSRQAGVQPATMTRLAKHLGLDGYDDLRTIYAEALRNDDPGFAGKADAQARKQHLKGDHALAAEMLNSIGRQIQKLTDAGTLESIVGTARRLAKARRVYCLGLRSSHSVIWQLHYILNMIGEKSTILDGTAGTGIDAICNATSDDVLLAVSILPYTRATIETAEYAYGRGIPILAITDSEVSPLAALAEHSILISTSNPSFFHAMTPAFAVSEVLAALTAGHGGEPALKALRQFDEQLRALNIHINVSTPKRSLTRQ